MSQQINLYSPQFRRRKKPFTSKAMLQTLGIIVVALAAFYAYARYQVTSLGQQAAQHERQVKAGLERLKGVPSAIAPADEKALDSRIADLTGQIQQREQVMAQVSASEAPTDYTAPLRALARHRLEGVWLTSITLAGESGELSLVGKALRPELVPLYIERLARDPALRGRRFATLAVERAAQSPSETKAEAAAPVDAVGFRLLASPEGN